MTAILLCSLLVSMTGGAAEVDESNIPTEVSNCLKRSAGLFINGDFNPFYISADFDGDGRLDFAVQVRRQQRKDILVCLTNSAKPILLSSGVEKWSSAEEWRFDAWSVVPKHNKSVSWPAGAKGDALLLDVKETANGLVYWDGKVFRWKQLED